MAEENDNADKSNENAENEDVPEGEEVEIAYSEGGTPIEPEVKEDTVPPVDPKRDKQRIVQQDLLDFLFPENLGYPKSSARLFVFAEYGPLFREHDMACFCEGCRQKFKENRKKDKSFMEVYHGKKLVKAEELDQYPFICESCIRMINGVTRLKGGFRSTRVIDEHALALMEERILRNDLLGCFSTNDKNPLKTEDENMIIQSQPNEIKFFENITKEEVQEMFEGIECDDDGTYSFHDMSKKIREYRKWRKEEMFRRSAGNFCPHKGNARGYRPSATMSRAAGLATKVVPDHEQMENQDTLLHKNVFSISALGQSNDPSHLQTCYLMRELKPDNSFKNKWDGNSCGKNGNRGHYVKSKPNNQRLHGIE